MILAIWSVAAVAATGPDVQATLERAGGGATAGQSFFAIAAVENTASQSERGSYDYTLKVEVPTGVTVVGVFTVGHAGAPPCEKNASGVTCTGRGLSGVHSSVGFRLELRASRAGSFMLRNEVTVTDGTDPNPANNTAELSVSVAEAPLAVAGLVRSPTPPRAGRALRATLLLSKGGAPVRAVRTTCRLSIGGRVVPARASNVATGGRCTWLVPVSAKGKQLSGAVTATASGKSFTSRFAGKAA